MERQKEELKKQHPVPQNIMEVEFKLVGDMTLRQFAYVAAGAVLGYIIYAQPITGVIRWPLIITDALVALGLAFLPMEERGLDEWFRNFFNAVYSPTQRIWKGTATTAPRTPRKGEKRPAKKPKGAAQQPKPKQPPSEKKEQPPKKEDKTEKKEIEKKKKEVRELSNNLKKSVEKTKKETPKTEQEAEKKVASITKELDKILKKIGGSQPKDVSAQELREENRLLKKRLITLSEQYKKLKELEGAEETPANLKQTIRYYKDQLETLKEKNRALNEELEKRESMNGNITQEKKKLQKELEEKLKAAEENNAKLEEKINSLQEQIKKFEDKTSQLHKKNKKYHEELQEKENDLTRLERERTRAVSKMMELKSKLEGSGITERKEPKKEKDDLQQKKPQGQELKQKAKEGPKRVLPKKEPKKSPTPEEELQERKETAPIIDNIPNVINGVVKDSQGDLVAGQMVIIEDSDGDPVRALKTNKLGQFAVSTPLPNGAYTVKVSNGSYKPAKVTTDGSVLDPITFREQ